MCICLYYYGNSEEEILNISRGTVIQITIPNSLFDFTRPLMPRKRNYDSQIQYIQYGVHQKMLSHIYPIYVKTDHGLISEDYQINSLDFNVDRTEIKNYMRESEDDCFFDFSIQMAYLQQTYYRKNIKIKDIISSLGGILNILVLLGNMICNKYNSNIYMKRFIEKSFPKQTQK